MIGGARTSNEMSAKAVRVELPHARIREAARWRERWLSVDEGVELRVLEWSEAGCDGRRPVIFVAGWVSVMEGWTSVLERLGQVRPVVYVETREKRSARLGRRRLRPDEFTVPRLAMDLVHVADGLDIDCSRAIWFGSSMGANAILEALKGGRLPARGAFLVGPNAGFAIPWWGRPLLWSPSGLYHVIKYFVIWYLRHFRVDERAEPEQMLRYERTLLAADPLRLKLSARAVARFDARPGLETISTPVTIAYASTDRLHGENDVDTIVAAVSTARALRCPSNGYMHDPRIVDDLEAFIASLDGG